MPQIEVLKKYLAKLSIDPETTDVYIELHKLGPTSALQLSKETKISRTQIYRHLEELQSKALVSAEELSYGTLFRALPLENVEALIANREAENAAIKRNLSSMSQALQMLAGSSGPKATVHHYYGMAGLKQVNWNLTKAEKEFKVFEAAHLSQHLDKAFARRCRERFIERKLTSYDLTNSTKVTLKEIEPVDISRSFYRHVEPSKLKLDFEVYMYNDVVTLLDYNRENQTALEIHHPALKNMMEQLFDTMWSLARPIEISK